MSDKEEIEIREELQKLLFLYDGDVWSEAHSEDVIALFDRATRKPSPTISKSVGGDGTKTFDFLNDPKEDIYTEKDGEPIDQGDSPTMKKENIKPDYYYSNGYKEGVDPEVTCWNCGKTFLCDAMDACCRLCHAPFAKERCEEFGFVPTPTMKKEAEQKCIPCSNVWHSLTYEEYTGKYGAYPRSCPECHSCFLDRSKTETSKEKDTTTIPWQQAFAKEFRKHYEGILTKETIEKAILWNLEFMGTYMSQAGKQELVPLDVKELWREIL